MSPQRNNANVWTVLAILGPLVLFWVTSSKQSGRIETAVEQAVRRLDARDQKDQMQDERLGAMEVWQSGAEERVKALEARPVPRFTPDGRRIQ